MMPHLTERVSTLLIRPVFQITLILLFGVLAYSNTFQVPFVFDDIQVIVDNRNLDSLSAFLSSYGFRDSRWLPLVTLAINRELGGMEVAGFHVVNLGIHLTAGLVIYLLAKTVMVSFGEACLRRFEFAPFISSLLFVLHPLQTQSVTYIVQRMTSLATLFYLAAILLYAKSFNVSVEKTDIARPGNNWTYPAAVISCILAMSSKEISFTLPVSLVIYEICFLKGTIRNRFFRLIPFFLCQIILFFLLIGMEKWSHVQLHGGGDNVSIPISRTEYLITEFRVLITYLRLLILPVGQNFDYDYQKFSTLLHPEPALSLAVLSCMVLSGVLLIIRSFRTTDTSAFLQRLSGFAVIWFFVTISVESGLVPLIDTIYEHRVYLPSSVLFIAAGSGVCELYQRAEKFRSLVVMACSALILILGVATFQRNSVWKDTLTLWTDITEKSPGRARGWTNLGYYYVNILDPVKAVPFLEHAVMLNPGYYPAHYWLGRAYVQLGKADSALDHFLIALELAPGFSKAWEAAGRLLLEKNEISEAVRYFNTAIEIDPYGFVSHGHLQQAEKMLHNRQINKQ